MQVGQLRRPAASSSTGSTLQARSRTPITQTHRVPTAPPSTGYGSENYDDGGVFGHYPPDALYEEDEEDESSDDGDVFAYLPPTTADQLEDQQSQIPPQSSDSRPFQYSPGGASAFAHAVPEADQPPLYPGRDTASPYSPISTGLTTSTGYTNGQPQPPMLHRSPSHPPSAVLQSRAPQSFSSNIPLVSPATSPYAIQHPVPQQPYVPGDAYRMRDLGNPASVIGAPPPLTSASDPSRAELTTASSVARTSAGGRVSITTSGVSSRSREVHVTLPPSRGSPPSDAEANSALASPVSQVPPGGVTGGGTDGAAHSPIGGATNNAGVTVLPQTPIEDIDQLYYEDARKGYSRQTTADSMGQPRKRRRQKTSSTMGMSIDEEYGDYIYGDDDGYDQYDDGWNHHAGKDDKVASGSYNGRGLSALEAGSPHHGHHHHGTPGTSVPGTANSNGGLGSGQVVSGAYVLGTGGGGGDINGMMDDDDEDSPYPEVRASVSNIDDPDMPVLTVRMWILGISLCVLGAAANTFFNFRYPSPTITPVVLLLLAHPAGKFLAYTMPIESFVLRLPRWVMFAWWKICGWFTLREWRRRRREDAVSAASAQRKEADEICAWEWEIHLNPGPFNIKVRCSPEFLSSQSACKKLLTDSFAVNPSGTCSHLHHDECVCVPSVRAQRHRRRARQLSHPPRIWVRSAPLIS